MEGKKTYLVCALGLGYLAGVAMGWWPYNQHVLEAIGFTGLATMRAGIKKAQAAAETNSLP